MSAVFSGSLFVRQPPPPPPSGPCLVDQARFSLIVGLEPWLAACSFFCVCVVTTSVVSGRVSLNLQLNLRGGKARVIRLTCLLESSGDLAALRRRRRFNSRLLVRPCAHDGMDRKSSTLGMTSFGLCCVESVLGRPMRPMVGPMPAYRRCRLAEIRQKKESSIVARVGVGLGAEGRRKFSTFHRILRVVPTSPLPLPPRPILGAVRLSSILCYKSMGCPLRSGRESGAEGAGCPPLPSGNLCDVVVCSRVCPVGATCFFSRLQSVCVTVQVMAKFA